MSSFDHLLINTNLMSLYKLQFPIIISLFLTLNSLPLFSQSTIPEIGIYDGKVGDDQVILVAETADSSILKGYFVLNKGKAIEESHSFLYDPTGSRPHFQSDLYLGKIKKSKFNSSSFDGTISLLNKKKRFLFWRPKASLNFVRRPDIQVTPSDRYQTEIFSGIEVKSNLLYGKAKGLWVSSPYSDAPYIEVLSKGLVKSFRDPELMNLNLDIYYPKTDIFKNRPLVMLIHGGAFYIGSKETAAEKSLATSLAKRGYVVASIDYRLGFKLLASDVEMSAYRAIQDAHAALRFLAHNAKGLGIDPDQIYVGGTSAGAVASLNVAFMRNDERPKRILEAAREGSVMNIEESGNKYTESFKIKAVVNMWGAVSDLNIIDKDEKISVLSIHGTADDIVPYEYNHPFEKLTLVNRLVMDKMYGSKPIHDRLNALGTRNRLVAFEGLGHEPELATYNTLNHYMDTITNQVSRFFYEETSPTVVLPPKQLTVSPTDDIKPVLYEVINGSPVLISVVGGVKTNSNPTDSSIIWIKNATVKEFTIWTNNKFNAWNSKSYRFEISK